MDVTTAPRGELLRLVYELFDKVEALEAENAHLKEQLHQKTSGGGTAIDEEILWKTIHEDLPPLKEQISSLPEMSTE